MARIAIHPGEHLAEELGARGISATELARLLEMPTGRIADVLAGRGAITDDLALGLAHVLGASAQFWLNLQSLYELNRKKAGSGEAASSSSCR